MAIVCRWSVVLTFMLFMLACSGQRVSPSTIAPAAEPAQPAVVRVSAGELENAAASKTRGLTSLLVDPVVVYHLPLARVGGNQSVIYEGTVPTAGRYTFQFSIDPPCSEANTVSVRLVQPEAEHPWELSGRCGKSLSGPWILMAGGGLVRAAKPVPLRRGSFELEIRVQPYPAEDFRLQAGFEKGGK